MFCLHWGKWKLLSIIRNHSAYVDALGNTVAQFDGQVTIDVYAFNSVRSSSSYSQFSWVIHFPQNFLARCIASMISFLIGTAHVVIDVLLTVLHS